ncbi:group 3 secretory phospholipase A2-like isoform X2 [Palaemon carinicauda]|uniref:group 3 secretory phospholipase A2-like isoform X2 n=1 Tax=Palaemon carinicauda TaxID=392227 RepID=UPI0035B5BFC9
MNLFSVSLLFLCLVLKGVSSMPNFMTQDDLADGQHEIRIHFNGINAKQTSVGHNQGSESGLVLRQVSRHRHMVTLIYVGEVQDDMGVDTLSLRDCEVTSDATELDNFLDTFRKDVDSAQVIVEGSGNGVFYNTSYVPITSEDEIPEYLRPVLHFRQLRAECKAHHRTVRKAAKASRRQAESSRELEPPSLSRSKRWVLNELLIMPGTKWCGNEDLADSFRDLSGYVGADHCCRQHDMCNINIPGLTRKFGIYNSRLTTISHCACDERFRACLKMSKTGAADMVGNVFFDVVKTRCFVFKKEKVCKKTSWWGKCEKYRIQGVAALRDPIPFSS